MKSTVSLEGIKKAVFFPFQGEKWAVKLLIGTALTFGSFIIPVVPIIPVFGYFAEIMHAVIVDEEDPKLPDWNDWGALFLNGIKLFGAIIIYFLPTLILTISGYALFLIFDLSMVFTTSTAVGYSSNPFPASAIFSSLGMFAGLAVLLFGFLLGFITIIFIPPAIGNLIEKGEFGAAFRLREWWPVLKKNLTGYILAIAISLGLIYLLYMLVFVFYATIVLCFLVPFVFAFIFFISGMLVQTLFAVAYRDGKQKLSASA